MKTCSKCMVALPLEAFCRKTRNKDGLCGVCRACKKPQRRERRLRVLGRIEPTQAGATKVCTQCKAELPIESFERAKGTLCGRRGKCNKCQWADRVRINQQRPEKYLARNATWAAVQAGRIVRGPCEQCGDLKVEAHHRDYSKPLEVTWLCRAHHLTEHGGNPLPPIPRETP